MADSPRRRPRKISKRRLSLQKKRTTTSDMPPTPSSAELAGGGRACLKPPPPLIRTNLAHHFEDAEQQHESGIFGMWVFLATEIMFFGGIFAAYAIYRGLYLPAFEFGSRLLDIKLGTTNTAILIASSLTMALAVHAAQTGKRKALIVFFVPDDGSWLGVPRHQIHGIRPRNGSISSCPACASPQRKRCLPA